MATSQNLEDMKLPQLKEVARQMGLRGTSTMRKPELLATLQAARSGGEPPAGVTVRAPKTAKAPKAAAPVSGSDAGAAPAPSATAPSTGAGSASDAPKKDAWTEVKPQETSPSDSSAVPASSPAEAPHVEAPSAEEDRIARGGGSHRAVRSDEEPRRPVRRAHRRGEAVMPTDSADLLEELGIGASETRPRREVRDENGDEVIVANVRRRRRSAEPEQSHDGSGSVRVLDDILATLPGQDAGRDHGQREEREGREEREERDFPRRDRRGRASAEGRDGRDRRGRRLRGRSGERDFDERDERREGRREEPAEDLVPVAGIVDVLDSYAFVRTSGYLPGPNDVYVSMGQVKKYGLRKGDAVHGAIRPPREGDRRNQRQKFVPLQSIDSINGMSVEEAANRPQFSKLTPLYPQERLRQETAPNKLIGRIIDIVAPIGKGQRGLIVSPPKAGKTITLQNIANAIATNNPEVHLMVVLVDERPEEVTDMERTVQGEVISSTFDRPASDHTTVAELAIERAKRLVELGQDVVVLLDSMTRLARAYNIAAPASGRILSGGVDAQALYPSKKFFGAARNIENGGSLTSISSALVETGSRMDEVIFEEFKGTGNMELRLSRDLADKRMFPAIDINASGTRREELITPPGELPVIYRLRRLFGGMEPEQAYQTLVPRLKKTATNHDFLAAIVQQSGMGSVNGN